MNLKEQLQLQQMYSDRILHNKTEVEKKNDELVKMRKVNKKLKKELVMGAK